MENKTQSCFRYLMIVLAFAAIINARAASHMRDSSGLLKDSLVRNYLVCEKKKNRRAVHFFTDGQVLTVEDSMGRIFKGNLKILNNENFVLISKSGKQDTFSLGAVSMIKRVATIDKVFGVVFGLIGAAGVVGGSLLLTDAQQYGDPYGLETIVGLAVLQKGILCAICSSALFAGDRYKGIKYTFRVVQTEGFELKRKHLKHL